MNGFYPVNSKVLLFTEDDCLKIRLNHYIIRKENLQRLKNTLPKWHFMTTNRNISTDLNISASTAGRLMKELEKLGIIECVKKSNSSKEGSVYRYILDYNDKLVDDDVCESVYDSVDNSNCNDLDEIDESVYEGINESVDEPSKKDLLKRVTKKDIYNAIIEKLNQRTGKRLKSTTSKNKSMIDARINEGFTLEDFYAVIDYKSNEWGNSDMERYLRPETLFSGKFERYLNESIKMNGYDKVESDTSWEPEFDYN